MRLRDFVYGYFGGCCLHDVVHFVTLVLRLFYVAHLLSRYVDLLRLTLILLLLRCCCVGILLFYDCVTLLQLAHTFHVYGCWTRFTVYTHARYAVGYPSYARYRWALVARLRVWTTFTLLHGYCRVRCAFDWLVCSCLVGYVAGRLRTLVVTLFVC